MASLTFRRLFETVGKKESMKALFDCDDRIQNKLEHLSLLRGDPRNTKALSSENFSVMYECVVSHTCPPAKYTVQLKLSKLNWKSISIAGCELLKRSR